MLPEACNGRRKPPELCLRGFSERKHNFEGLFGCLQKSAKASRLYTTPHFTHPLFSISFHTFWLDLGRNHVIIIHISATLLVNYPYDYNVFWMKIYCWSILLLLLTLILSAVKVNEGIVTLLPIFVYTIQTSCLWLRTCRPSDITCLKVLVLFEAIDGIYYKITSLSLPMYLCLCLHDISYGFLFYLVGSVYFIFYMFGCLNSK